MPAYPSDFFDLPILIFIGLGSFERDLETDLDLVEPGQVAQETGIAQVEALGPVVNIIDQKIFRFHPRNNSILPVLEDE